MAENLDVDFSFLEKHEGKKILNGYVPHCTKASIAKKNPVCIKKKEGDAIGKSGVTVSTGFDLGQFNESDLRRIGINNALVTKLKPFLTKKKKEAIDALALYEKENNLKFTISPAEEREISGKLKAKFYGDVQSKLEKKYGENSFKNLPTNAKTAIFSMLYQFGPNTQNAEITKAVDNIMKQDYAAASNDLNQTKNFAGRRKDEAKLLDAIGGNPAKPTPTPTPKPSPTPKPTGPSNTGGGPIRLG